MLLVCAFLTAVVMKLVLGYDQDFSWSAAIMFGSMVSATDPVAVVAMLKELGASKRISILIEGESLLNDGTAMVAFLVVHVLLLLTYRNSTRERRRTSGKSSGDSASCPSAGLC